MKINDLPVELLEQVHLRLPPSGLKNAVLVCQRWRAVGEEPTLWEWCTVTVYSREDVTNLASRRLQKIQQISISPEEWNTGDWEAFFHATMELACLSKIDGRIDGIRNPFLRAVDTDLFARSLARLEMVDVKGGFFNQIEALFNKMSQGTKLKKLELSDHDSSQMDPGLFAGVLSKLEDVKLDHNKTTDEQMKALFTHIMDESRLKRLSLDEKSASHLEPKLFARALAKIEEVRVYNDVTSHQIGELFTALAHETSMKKLALSSNVDVSEVNLELFSKSLSRLEEVMRFSRGHTTNDQIQALFTQMSVETHLKKLYLHENFSRLNPGLFSMALVRMEEVFLTVGNRLTTNQLVAFFTEALRSTHLKKLAIFCVNLSSVAPAVLAQAVTRLEVVELVRARLTDDQWLSLFTEMSGSGQMKNLIIQNSSKISSVGKEVLSTALNRLDEVTLMNTGITPHQAWAFFSEMAQNTKLMKIHIIYEDLSTIDPEVLANALTKLKEVDLGHSHLSRGQITAILSRVLETDNNLRKLSFPRKPRCFHFLADANQEIVRKVKDKLKGKFSM